MAWLKTSDFDYTLPEELIAQTPVEPKDSSRLLVAHRETGELEHRLFSDLVEYLQAGDVLALNESRVPPARPHGRRRDTGGQVELLLLRRLGDGLWDCLGKPGKRLRPGMALALGQGSGVEAEVVEALGDGVLGVRFSQEKALEGIGETPLPPYLHQPLQHPERCQAKGVELAFVTLHIGLDTSRPV